MNKPRVIAFYLPQFYPTPENDEWWEPGFTEWTNVAKAKPLFRGHYQPRIPRDLGFYDLRVPETREKQAEMAKEAGIEGFCYWHYWFGNGRRLLSEVFKEVVMTGKPDFPFCLCWANHSWFAKTWDPKLKDKLLMEQLYPGEEDYVNHFMEMLPAFRDPRYIKTQDGRLLFGFFDYEHFDDFPIFKDVWNKLALKNGLKGFDFFAFVQGKGRLNQYKLKLYDSVVYDAMNDCFKQYGEKSLWRYVNAIRWRLGIPIRKARYSTYVNVALSQFKLFNNFIPSIGPMFDHTPRSAGRGVIFNHDSPKEWGKLCRETRKIVEKNQEDDKFIFIRAWNEWGEGNYMEPDSKFGKQYIEEAGRVFKM